MKNQPITKEQAVEILNQDPYIHMLEISPGSTLGQYIERSSAISKINEASDICIAESEYIDFNHSIKITDGLNRIYLETDLSRVSSLYPMASTE